MQMISAGIIEEWPLLSELEGRYVRRVLAHTGGNKQAASRILGVDRKTIERMIKRHQIDLTGEIQSPSQD
jgi:DNA-binding NtrC family response regulator